MSKNYPEYENSFESPFLFGDGWMGLDQEKTEPIRI